ncbi:MAG: OadG family protein [candidate division Zixibacteria bacterium]|nr:OadG family protein [candidate division Zixibacteria bacterium]
MQETLGFTIKFSIVGILIVFSALTFISIIVSLLKRTDDRWQAHELSQQEATASEGEANIDILTLVIISAAAATVLQGRYYVRKIRRIRRLGAKPGSWTVQGRSILLGSHLVSKKK